MSVRRLTRPSATTFRVIPVVSAPNRGGATELPLALEPTRRILAQRRHTLAVQQAGRTPSTARARGRDGSLILAVFVLSGAAGLVYEVVWARQLVLVFGNTTQAVSAILTGFFGGMALGSAAGGRLADRVRSPLRLYGLLEIAIAAVALATPVLFSVVRASYREAYPLLENTPLA